MTLGKPSVAFEPVMSEDKGCTPKPFEVTIPGRGWDLLSC